MISISNSDAASILRYLADAQALYPRNSCRAWMIKKQVKKLQNKLNNR